MSHTPGPWTFFHDTCRKCEENGTQEWEVMEPPQGYHARFTNEADARLIAAAPDMLTALECASNVLSLLEAEVKALGLKAENVPGMVRAAIEKARQS